MRDKASTGVADACAEFITGVNEGVAELFVAVPLAFDDKFRARRTPLLMDENVVHTEVAGAGCAEGVEPCPFLNVDVPYTPMGFRASLYHTVAKKHKSTHVAAIAFASIKDSGVVVAGHVPLAAHDIINVLTISCRLGAWLARAEAELGIRHVVLQSSSCELIGRRRPAYMQK